MTASQSILFQIEEYILGYDTQANNNKRIQYYATESGHALLYKNNLCIVRRIQTIKELESAIQNPTLLDIKTRQNTSSYHVIFVFEVECTRICQVKHELKPCLCGASEDTYQPFYNENGYHITICSNCIKQLQNICQKNPNVYIQGIGGHWLHSTAANKLSQEMKQKIPHFLDTGDTKAYFRTILQIYKHMFMCRRTFIGRIEWK